MGRTAKIFLIMTFAGALVNFKNCDIFFGMNRIKNERGFLMLNVVFLTLITSFAAMILLNAAPRVRNSQSRLRLTALYLADEQFAQLESLAAGGTAPTSSEEFLGESGDLTTNNFGGKDYQVTFNVKTEVINNSNPYEVTVTVSWIDSGKNFSVKVQRMIWVAESSESS